MNSTFPTPNVRGRTRPLQASSAQRPPAASPAQHLSSDAQPEQSDQTWGRLSVRTTSGDIIGSGFYSSEGRVTLIFEGGAEPGRILVYDRTPEHPGSDRISPNLNLKDATNGDDHLAYIGKLRPLKNYKGWWGDLERMPAGRDQNGKPRCFACVPPHPQPSPARKRTPTPQSGRRHGKPLWGTKGVK